MYWWGLGIGISVLVLSLIVRRQKGWLDHCRGGGL